MPKYIPTDEDLYSTKPCFICGRDVIETNEDTCSTECFNAKQDYYTDAEEWLWEDI